MGESGRETAAATAAGPSRAARDYLAAAVRVLERESPIQTARRIERLTSEHEHWRSRHCLNMNAAEGLMSCGARRLLASDFAARVTEGVPGDKVFPHRRQNRFIDEIEATLIGLTQKLFKVQHVEWRPVTTSMANAAVFVSLTKPGDTILVQPEAAGGNYSYNVSGFPPLVGLKVAALPYTGSCFELDIERAEETVRRTRPRLIVIGGSNVLFPYPVRALRALADAVGALLVYDAAHVGLLIAANRFQLPLSEGAHLMTLSTHKMMAGAVGGMVLSDDPKIIATISRSVFPHMLQTRDQNKYAATAYAFAEHLEFRDAYTRQIVANAQALGRALTDAGFEVFGEDRGFSMTHQVFLRHPTIPATDFEDRCQQADILAARTLRTAGVLNGQPGGVIRLSVQEITRQGLTEPDMVRVAGLIGDAVNARRTSEDISRAIADWVSGLGPIRFSFDVT
ncbi:MAG: aminotransferase class I/II-fold pyridoxal phosphate-dependent enzyme [Steroidobacteraceae bacterium]